MKKTIKKILTEEKGAKSRELYVLQGRRSAGETNAIM